MFHVYVLKSCRKDNWHYVGSSADPRKRTQSHNRGKVRATKGYRELSIIYTEAYATRSEAYRMEMYYKTAEGKAELKAKLTELGVW